MKTDNVLSITPNTVYIDIEVAPQYGVHQFIKKLKVESSRILREAFPELKKRLPTLWTNSYLILTQVDDEAVITYKESLPISQRQEEKERGVKNENCKKNNS